MKDLNLEQLGVQELNVEEVMETDGGCGFWCGVILGGLIYDILSDPGAVIDGYKKGYEAGYNK